MGIYREVYYTWCTLGLFLAHKWLLLAHQKIYPQRDTIINNIVCYDNMQGKAAVFMSKGY